MSDHSLLIHYPLPYHIIHVYVDRTSQKLEWEWMDSGSEWCGSRWCGCHGLADVEWSVCVLAGSGRVCTSPTLLLGGVSVMYCTSSP